MTWPWVRLESQFWGLYMQQKKQIRKDLKLDSDLNTNDSWLHFWLEKTRYLTPNKKYILKTNTFLEIININYIIFQPLYTNSPESPALTQHPIKLQKQSIKKHDITEHKLDKNDTKGHFIWFHKLPQRKWKCTEQVFSYGGITLQPHSAQRTHSCFPNLAAYVIESIIVNIFTFTCTENSNILKWKV